MLAWLFPGQGAQHRGMGSDLFERYPEEVAAADSCLGYSVAELCRDDPHDQLTGTRYAQPALFVVGALSALSAAEHSPRPDFLVGHSLGEYAALFAAGCFDLTTGTRLVDRRGELMAEAGEGGMLAVLGPGAKDVKALLAEIGQHDVDLANDNAHDQVVLSGPVASLRTVGREVRGSPAIRAPTRRLSPTP
ncbi:MAG: acyltransferase domain-containing protein [Pseudonocardiaceae bacterium]